jgi:hypothetical protein
MTIVASVKVRDGLILSTDSMTTISSSEGVLKTYSNARKLFRITGRPVGVMTYGLGNIGPLSIEGLVVSFCKDLDGEHGSVGELAQDLFAFLKGIYETEFGDVPINERPELGFLMAGYSANQPLPEEYEFLFPGDPEPSLVREPDVFGASWRGQSIPFVRLYKGFDPRIVESLKSEGLTDQQIESATAGLEADVIFEGMPVQDALNFATFMLDSTIAYTAFEVGAATCGHPLQVATILADEGFKWVAKPELRVEHAVERTAE